MNKISNFSSSLEIEAADYFNLNLNQLRLFDGKKHRIIWTSDDSFQINGIEKLNSNSKLKLNQARKMQVQLNKKQNEKSKSNLNYNKTSLKASRFCHRVDFATSSTTSTNSLPSISSSPSMSSSLVCPHLSLDDILKFQAGESRSPHTIGLCRKCRLNPPAGIQSPLSPAFKPSVFQSEENLTSLKPFQTSNLKTAKLRRGFSDHQAKNIEKHNQIATKFLNRDDSLDYFIEPKVLQTIQLAPNIKNGVEFIRNNSIESGRVLTIFKNGLPFDKPLKICITRDEFKNLNQMLDFINTRQLIPSGARYLFHLDGQLVYSVHELKHGSIYIVSGNRTFNFRLNELIKINFKKQIEYNQLKSIKRQQYQTIKNKRLQSNEIKSQNNSIKLKLPNSDEEKEKSNEKHKQEEQIEKLPTKPKQKLNLKYEPKFKMKNINIKSNEKVKSNSIEKINSQKVKINLATEKPKKRIIRAKSELSAISTKPKKNVTFFDTGRGSSPMINQVDSENNNNSNNNLDDLTNLDEINKNLTNEIGIQVSDSIDGLLVDLPILLPGDRKAPEVATGRRSKRKQPISKTNEKTKATNRKVITIFEKQLSNEEMNLVKDLGFGDHHREKQQVENDIKTKSKQNEIKSSINENEEDGILVFDRSGTISIGSDPSSSNAWNSEGQSPIERSVSQSDANELIHARVTTPTQIISNKTSSGLINEQTKEGKQRLPVSGRLFKGIEAPDKNLYLIWMNGFMINDLYPENAGCVESNICQNGESSNQLKKRATFKCSQRYNNWIFHSKLYDELVFPVGSQVVLWSYWNDEQRFYSRHSSDISAISIASLNEDLAISAQIHLPNEKIHSNIHLWSIKKLETLFIFHDDQLKNKLIFSLKINHPKLDGSCEISVASKDDKRMWLFLMKLEKSKTEDSHINQSYRFTSIKENKVLSNNQLPLLITTTTTTTKAINSKSNELIITFGRRLLNFWIADERQQKLKLIQTESKNQQFKDVITKATSFVRMSPMEFLIGDSDGNLTFLILELESQPKVQISSSLESSKRLKYDFKLVRLLKNLNEKDEYNENMKHRKSITSLARITGNLFASGDSECYIKIWKIERKSENVNELEDKFNCIQLNSIKLPQDLGFICVLLPAKYDRKKSIGDFYAISTSNTILFCSLQLANSAAQPTLSVIYEGHESSVMSLVADTSGPEVDQIVYFSCSLDCKICKWTSNKLAWKSILPSSCSALALHPTGAVLAVGSTDGTVYILDKLTGLLISYFPLTPIRVNCLAYSKDGAFLAAGCSNGSIFVLPVYENGLKYKKVSIFQSPHCVMSLQFSLDGRYILTSVAHSTNQELILWDLPNFRFLRSNVRPAADQIDWFDSSCSGSEDVRAIWENENLKLDSKSRLVINLACHRIGPPVALAVAGDARGHLRLFRYPSRDIRQGFFEVRVGSAGVGCCRLIANGGNISCVSASLDGSLCLWQIK